MFATAYVMSATADSRDAGFHASSWAQVVAFCESVYRTHSQSVFVFKNGSAKFFRMTASDVTGEWDSVEDYWSAYAASQDEHDCVIQETPDGMGCVRCLYA